MFNFKLVKSKQLKMILIYRRCIVIGVDYKSIYRQSIKIPAKDINMAFFLLPKYWDSYHIPCPWASYSKHICISFNLGVFREHSNFCVRVCMCAWGCLCVDVLFRVLAIFFKSLNKQGLLKATQTKNFKNINMQISIYIVLFT